ncbi:hypothetical protein EDB83DRAFT_231971 [Lactarius deliciosus]|nr:hypothetical protein EDB83DRAFT_231971 [Lactarius deliciosus]
MPRVGLPQLLKRLTHGIPALCGVFFFGFTVSTTHLLELGMQVQLVPFPDFPVHFRSPQPRRSAMPACFSTLSQPHSFFSPVSLIFLDLLRWGRSLMVLQVAGSSKCIKTWPSLCTRFEPSCAPTGRERTSPSRRQPGEITTGTCGSSSHHFDVTVRIGQRYRHDVVMQGPCAFIVIREAVLVL